MTQKQVVIAADMTRRPKLAQRLASDLAADILKVGLPAGASLGNEANLATRLCASRWTVREALTILNREGQVTIRRGRYGGIFVAAPNTHAISTSIRSYLEFIRVSVAEVIQARRILDEAILQIAVERVTAADIPQLRVAHDIESEVEGIHAGFVQYERLLAVARSPVLQIFVRAVGQLGQSAILRSTLSDAELTAAMRQVRIKRKAQIEAVIAGQVGEAWSIENDVLNVTTRMLESARLAPGTDTAAARLRALHLFEKARQFKRPELLMQEIGSDIVARGWPVGEHLGTEAELLKQYSVSRSTFREAVRSLEQMGVVEMRTGRYSGLKVSSPNPEAVISNSQLQLLRSGMTTPSLREALSSIGVAAAGLAAQQQGAHIDFDGLSRGAPALFFDAIGTASGNRIIALLMRILSQHHHPLPAGDATATPQDLLRSLASAIHSGDVAASRRHFLAIQFAR